MKITKKPEGLYWLLVQIMFQTKHRIQPIAESHGLTIMQANTLALLREDEPLTMNALAIYLACDASNVTGIADRLEDQGLIERRDNPRDRRVKMIILTTAGRKLREQIIKETIEVESDRVDPILTANEQKTLHELLQKILDSQMSDHNIK